MEITKDGFHLVIELEDLGPQFEFLVAYWRREPGAEEHVKMVRSGGIPVHLETMEPGAAYCVKAQTFVKAIGRYSAFSQTECVEVQGEAIPLVLALFAFVGFMLILVVVPLFVWKMGRLLQYSCCPVVVLPDTLMEFHCCRPGWSAVAQSWLTATSASGVQAILLPQPPEK
ncbi:interleukin-20 receptor subunit beta isoform X4 [Macaca fascicularis]